MCKFFSSVTNPSRFPGQKFYFDWEYRKNNLSEDNADSHSHICAHFKLNEDECNKYEYNPLTKEFVVDQINSEIDDSLQIEEWLNKLNFKKIVEPLIVKPIINPFLDLPRITKDEITDNHIQLLKEWASVGNSVWASVRDSVWDSVWASVWASVRNSVRDSVRDSVWDSVRDSVWDSVWDSVGNSVWTYVGSFFDIKYAHDFSSCIKLWEAGLISSFDGNIWRLHSGKNGDIVFEIGKDELGRIE